ncbi:MAG: CD1247 N-terminal domain-containing protein [Thermaerobacterales bacterium]
MDLENSRKQVAFLEGLQEGLGITQGTREGKIFEGILHALHGLADDLEWVAAQSQYLEDYVAELEERLYDLEDDAMDEEWEDDAEVLEFECPSCEEVFLMEDGQVWVDDETLDIICPHCGQPLAAELDAHDHELEEARRRGVADGHHLSQQHRNGETEQPNRRPQALVRHRGRER